jgi:4-amino-4-deoxy-L-arabinose transferase-like glycosyltransferase
MIKLPRLSLAQKTIALIVVVAAVLRLINFQNTLLFVGDQGRDAIIVANIFKNFDPVFIGPVTSVGNMYLGPLYYYFMLPFLMLSYPNPAGPAYAVAILGVITVWLMYKLGKDLVGEKAALVGALLMAISATAIQYTRFSWNPNPEPFVSLIMVWLTWYAWKHKPVAWIGVAVCVAILMQLHYVTLLTVAGAGLIWLWQIKDTLWNDKNRKLKLPAKLQKLWPQLGATLIGALIVILSLTPLVLFDSRHGWLNAINFTKLFTEENSFKVTAEVSTLTKITETLKETHGRALHVFFEFTLGENRQLNTLFLVIFLIVLGVGLWKNRRQDLSGLWVLLSFAAMGVLGTAFYQHTIFDHYIAFLFPMSFLLLAWVIVQLWQVKILGPILVIAWLGWFNWRNIPKWPIQSQGWTIFDMERTAQGVVAELKPGEKYNVVLLSESHDLYGQNYRYFLMAAGYPVLSPELASQADTLVVINEERQTSDVANLPIYEIVTFPVKTPEKVYTIPNGPEISIFRR